MGLTWNTKINDRVIRKSKEIAKNNLYVTSQAKLYKALCDAMGSDVTFTQDGFNREIKRNPEFKSELMKSFLNNQALGAVKGQEHLHKLLDKEYTGDDYIGGERIKMEAASKLTETGHKAVVQVLGVQDLKNQNANLKRELEELRKQLQKTKEEEEHTGGVIHVYHQTQDFDELMKKTQDELKKRMEEPE